MENTFLINLLYKLVAKADDGKRRPMKIQSLIFSKDHFKTAEEAKNWASKHNFSSEGVDETGESFRLRQKPPGGFKKMRTIELTTGVKAVVGKIAPIKKMSPTRSDVHVPTAGYEEKPVKKDAAIAPTKTAGELHKTILSEHPNIGGTIRSGSTNGSDVTPLDGKQNEKTREKFVFGPMVFDIDKAREMNGKEPNAMVKVSPDWSHQINVDTDAALKSTSENPVMIAQIPHTNGIENLLIDGHHRMMKALYEGKEELPAHIFSPEESMELCETHPDMKQKMLGDLEKARDEAGKVVGNKQIKPGAKRRNPSDFDQDELQEGTKHELEHTTNLALAQEIAMDHLSEDPKYYSNMGNKTSKDTNENQGETVTGVGQPSSGGMGDNALAGLYDMQSIVDGMDWELEHNVTEPDMAHEVALSNLQDDPEYYKKLRIMEDGFDWSTATGVQNLAEKGLKIDVGSGPQREKGFLGLDLVKHDHGTLVHDVHMGLPFPDGSASHVLVRNSLEHMDELSKDPKPLLSEIQRILMPGGQFVYEGPNQIENQPEFLKEIWRDKFHDAQDRARDTGHIVDKIEGNQKIRQEFTRIATPDAATANDSEPRIGVAQYDMLPADALLAMDAVGYYWSDATSSGRGNRLHGYPSQGALVKEDDVEKLIKAAFEAEKGILGNAEKGGPGSGRHPEGGSSKDSQETKQKVESLRDQYMRAKGSDRDKLKGELRQALAEHQEASQRDRSANYVHSLVGKSIPICKSDNMKQVVYGVVLAPNEVDLQEDWMTPEEIEKTAHFFMMNGQTIGKEHKDKAHGVAPVESYIAPVDFPFDGQYGKQIVKKGSWVLGVKVLDPVEWQKVVDGEYTGFSVGGWGQRTDSAGPSV